MDNPTATHGDNNDDADRIRVFCRVKPAELGVEAPGSTSAALRQRQRAVSRCVRTAGSGPFILPSTINAEISFQEYPVLAPNVVELARRNVTNPQRFYFDGVLNESCSQKDCFDLVARPLLRSLMAGYNAAIIAYGQTGSGKTFTVLGPPEHLKGRDSSSSAWAGGYTNGGNDGGGGGEDRQYDSSRLIYEGLLPRVLGHIIDLDNSRSNFGDEGAPGQQALPPEWRCSCFEIYCNSIYDLLAFDRQELASMHQSPIGSRSSRSTAGAGGASAAFTGGVAAMGGQSGAIFRQLALQIREDPVLGPYVEGLREVAVTSSDEALDLVRLSMAARATGETYVVAVLCVCHGVACQRYTDI